MKRRSVSLFLSLFAFPICLNLDAAQSPRGLVARGAAPAASDSSTPLPEQGRVVDGRYRNAYFGLTYPLPAGWSEQPAGRPPADDGSYVLTRFALYDHNHHLRARGSLAAQDLFFSGTPATTAEEMVEAASQSLAPPYEIESGPDEVTVAGRAFYRVAYGSGGLHWRVLSTDVRCHALTFTFSGSDAAALDMAEWALNGLSLRTADAPLCLTGYAQGDNILEQDGPFLEKERFETIPVRIIVGGDGQVKHVHLLSAFPDDSQAIIGALRNWRFKPFMLGGKAIAIETGLVFGIPRTLGLAASSP